MCHENMEILYTQHEVHVLFREFCPECDCCGSNFSLVEYDFLIDDKKSSVFSIVEKNCRTKSYILYISKLFLLKLMYLLATIKMFA